MSRRGLAVGLVLLVLMSCSDEHLDRATLLRDPAARLRFPGAVELGHVGGERGYSVTGPKGSFDGYILGTQATQREVHDYYARELQALGWILDPLVGTPTTTDIAAYGWCRGGFNFRIGIEDQRKSFGSAVFNGQTFVTVFRATIDSRGRSVPCPYVAPKT